MLVENRLAFFRRIGVWPLGAFPRPCWQSFLTPAVCELIKQECGLSMPIRTCGEYLKRWGFTPQKPAKRAYEQNPQAVAKWMEETYPTIAKESKSKNAEIHWGDETRPAQNEFCIMDAAGVFSVILFWISFSCSLVKVRSHPSLRPRFLGRNAAAPSRLKSALQRSTVLI